MKIQLAQHYGLCFGVRDALAKAARLAETVPLTMLGELVHNPVVVLQLEAQGVKRGELQSIQAETQHVMITAHGASNERRIAWNSAGFSVSDATCPLVHRAHDTLAKLVAAGCFPVVIGKRGHVEVLGLTGDFPNAFVVESETDLRDLAENPHYGVIAQTTQPIERVERLVALLRTSRPASVVTFRDTVCQPTKNRQIALRQLLETCDTMVVVGGRNSNNTLQLVAAATVAGLDVHHVERPNELQLDWFSGSQNVGLTAGTSTLKETVAAVHARLLEIRCRTAMNISRRIRELCRADQTAIAAWLDETSPRWHLVCGVIIIVGSALYGGVIGLWRAPSQAAFTAVKMPLLILLTAAGNALLNGLLAQVLGSGLSLRHSAILVLLSFTLAALLLGAFSPVVLFLLVNAPPLHSASRTLGHSITLLGDVGFVAYAGVVANRRLLRLLETLCATPRAGRHVFWSWLAGNLLLGAQLSWVLRPFIGSPGWPVEFLRADPFRGNFFEATLHAFQHLLR